MEPYKGAVAIYLRRDVDFIKAQTKKQMKKFISLLLALILALQVFSFPVAVFADEGNNHEAESQANQDQYHTPESYPEYEHDTDNEEEDEEDDDEYSGGNEYDIEGDYVADLVGSYANQPFVPFATIIDATVHRFTSFYPGNVTPATAPDGQPALRFSGTSGTGSQYQSWIPIITGPYDLSAYWGGYFVFEIYIPNESFRNFYYQVYNWLIIENPAYGFGSRSRVRMRMTNAMAADAGTWATVYVPLVSEPNMPGNNDFGQSTLSNVSRIAMFLRWHGGIVDSPVFINNPRMVAPSNPPASQVVGLTFDENTGTATATRPATGQDVEFAIGTSYSGLIWEPGMYDNGVFTHNFTSLPNQTYFVYARAVASSGPNAALYTWDGVAASVVVTIADDQVLVDNTVITWDTIRGTNTWGDQDVRRPLVLQTLIGDLGSQVNVSWSSDTTGAISNTGVTNRLFDRENNKDIVLTATITRGTASPREIDFNLRMLAVPAATVDRPFPNLSNTVAATVEAETVRRINITNWGNYHVMHILNGGDIGAVGSPAMVDFLPYADQYFVFEMRVSDASLLELPGDNWFVIDHSGDWNTNSRLQLPVTHMRLQEPNEWFTVAVPMTAANATAGNFDPVFMDTVRRMGFHMSFGSGATGNMYIRNVRFSAVNPNDGWTPPPVDVGAYVFIDFNDETTMRYLTPADFTVGQPIVPIPPSTYADARAFGFGIDVGAGGDGGRANFMQLRGGLWGMSRGNFIYVHVLDPDVRFASRVEVEIVYWQEGGANTVNLQYASTAASFTGAQLSRVVEGEFTAANDSWSLARGILDNANFGNDPQPGGHNQGASFRITGPGSYDGIVIRSIRITEILLSDQEAVNAAFNGLTWDSIRGGNALQTLVEHDLNLITAGTSGTTIAWTSSHDAIVDPNTGEVTRPTDNTTVTLTATITRGDVSRARTFTLIIRGAGIGTDQDAVEAMYAALTWDMIRGVNVSQTNVTTNLVLPHMGIYNTDITWTSSNTAYINPTTLTRGLDNRDIVSRQGVIPATRPDAAATVTITARIERGTEHRIKDFVLTVPGRYDWASHMRQAIAQQFEAKDHAISDFNVLGFGAMTREMALAAGLTEFCNREAFQAAIDAAFHNGGGVVYAPAGIYDFRTSVTGTRTAQGIVHEFQRVLSLHRGVQLRGEWDTRINDPSWQGTSSDPLGGTILAIYAGAGTDNFQTYVDSDDLESQTGQPMAANVSDRFICMDQGTGVTNLSIWYPEQDINATTVVTVRDAHGRKMHGQTEVIQGIPFPWTFVQRQGNSATIDNVTLVNAWNGFIAFPAELHYLVNTNMTALSHGIVVHTCTDIGRIENVNINPGFWARSGLPGAPSYAQIRSFTRAHGVGFRMHRSDWEYIYGLNITGYNIGIWIGREIVGNEEPNGQIFNSHILDSVVALHIDGVNSYGFLISNSTFEGSTAAVYLDTNFRTSLQFNGVTLRGPVINNGLGQWGVLSFESCVFDYNGYNLQLNNRGVALITQSQFLQSNRHIRMGANFDDVRVVNSGANFNMGYIYDVDIDITGSGYSAIVSSEYLFTPIPQNIRTDIAVHPRPASTNVLRVDLPRATGFNSALPTVDVSDRLQEALNFLAAQGGGTLLLPGGRYLIDNPIIVPTGVELRGTWDVQHHTQGGGTAIFTNYGSGLPYSATALVSLSTGSGLRGITFTQRNLTAVTHLNPANTPTFPFLVRGMGPNVHIINMTVHLGDNGIDLFTHDTSGHYVDYFGGTLLRRGIWVGGGASGGYIRNMQFNPHYTMRLPEGHQGFHIPSGDLFLFTQGWSSALMFGEVYNQTVFNNFVFGSVYGIHFLRDPNTGNYPGTINIVGHGSDGCTFALYVQHAGPDTVINAINSELVNTGIPTQPVRTYVRMGGPSVSDPDPTNWSIHADAQLNLFNSAFWGSPTTGAQIFGGIVRFQQANFSALGPGTAIGIDVTGGRAHIYSSRFAPTRGTTGMYVRLGPDGDGVELTNNFYRDGLSGNVVSYVEFGLFGADIGGEPFAFEMVTTGDNPRLRISYIVRGQSPSGVVRLVSPTHLAADFVPVPFDPIAAGQHIYIDFPNYSVHSLGLEVVLDGGRIFRLRPMIDRGFMERAVPGTTNPASRSTLPPLVMDNMNYVSVNTGPLSWTGPEDLSSISRFAFSDTHLYAYIVVNDRQHHNEQVGGNIWNGDSLQLGVDLLNITNGIADDPRRNELGFALNSNNGSIQRHRWNGSPGAASINGIAANITRNNTAGTTTYDLAIPVETVVNPALLLSGLERIGVSVFINDAVNGARAQELEVMSGHLKNPSLFTSLYLMGDGDYDAMIEGSASDMVDRALLTDTPADIATAQNFIALVRDPVVRDYLLAKLSGNVQVVPVTGVTIQGSNFVLEIPTTRQLVGVVAPSDATNRNVTWTSEDDTIATVDANGLVTAVSEGAVLITVTTVDGGYIATIGVIVPPQVTWRLGDVNGDGEVDHLDILMLRNYVTGRGGIVNRAAGDINNDGVWDMMDVQLLTILVNNPTGLAAPLGITPLMASSLPFAPHGGIMPLTGNGILVARLEVVTNPAPPPGFIDIAIIFEDNPGIQDGILTLSSSGYPAVASTGWVNGVVGDLFVDVNNPFPGSPGLPPQNIGDNPTEIDILHPDWLTGIVQVDANGVLGVMRFSLPSTVTTPVTFTLSYDHLEGFDGVTGWGWTQHTLDADPLTVAPPTLPAGTTTINVDYDASASSASIAIGGNPLPAVTLTPASTFVTWVPDTVNPATGTINVAPGLTVGTHNFTLTTSSTVFPDHTPATHAVQVIVSAVSPTITTHPTNQSHNPGGNATFTVVATGGPTPTIQWEVSDDGGSTWSPIGVPGATLAVPSVTLAMDGYQFRAVATNVGGSATSNAATLTVTLANVAPIITQQPTNETVITGGTATFTVAATGVPAPTFQWQVNTGTGWDDISGATDATLDLTNVTLGMSGNQYRVIVENVEGAITSTEVTLTVSFIANLPQPTPVPTPAPPIHDDTTHDSSITRTPTPTPPPPTPHPYIIPQYRTTVVISNAIAHTAATGSDLTIVFGMQERVTGVYIGAEISAPDWQLILEHEGEIILQGVSFSAHMTYEQLAKWDVDGASMITILLRRANDDIATQLSQDAITRATSQDPINGSLLNQLYNYTVWLDGEETNTASPVTITVDLAAMNLTTGQIVRLTGFVIDNETQTYVLLPGVFSADGRTFTFETDVNGIVGIMVHRPSVLMRLVIGSMEYTLNGITRTSDVAPHIAQNRALVPIRVVAEGLGAYARWDGVARVAYLYFDDITLRLPMGQQLPHGLGVPVMLNSRVFVPMRYVSYMIGAGVLWDEDNRAVYVVKW